MQTHWFRVFHLSSIFFLLLFSLDAVAQLAPLPLITRPVDESQLVTLRGNTHPLAQPQFDVGTAPPNMPLNRMLLVLKRSPGQDYSLKKLLDDQQDKNSPSYRKWLTPDQFGQQFGATDQDLQVVTGWLQTHGFQVSRVTHGRSVIEFSGVESQLESAFHTQIHQYMGNGQTHWANATDPQIPAALAPALAGLASLNNFPRQPMSKLMGTYSPKTRHLTPANPLFTLAGWGCDQDNNCYAVGPADFGTIYNVQSLWNSGIDGTGQTIAIVGESDINIQDDRDFRNLFGLPANDPNIIYDGPNPGFEPDESEADIDVQWAGAIAPKATIDFVVSQSTETTFGVDLSAIYIIDNNLAPVMSESYGVCELALGTSGNQFYNSLWAQAAAQGITAILASGDSGSATCDRASQGAQNGLEVSGFASTPYTVAIGGTDFIDFLNPQQYWNLTNATATQESAKAYIPETTWNGTCTNTIILGALGWGTNAENNCNNSLLLSQAPFLLYPTGGGGGVSNCTVSNGISPSSCSGGYTKPSWQVAPGVPADGKRDLPDVSLFASNGVMGNFYIFCESDVQAFCSFGQYGAAGGTSFGAPAFAGIMALVNQQMQAPQGNANYVLYKLAGQQNAASCNSSTGSGASCVFNDITSGTIAMPCLAGSPSCIVQTRGHQYGLLSGFSTGTGYDLATGLGSINVANLVNKWNTVTFRPTLTTLSLSPTTNLTHGQAVTVTGSVAPSSGSGTPTGAVSLLTSLGVAAGGFTLNNGTISGNTDLLPGGTYTITAHYAGDATFGGSDSNPVQVQVVAESSKTFAHLVTLANTGAVTSFSAANATYGSGYYLLRLDVGDSAATLSPSTGISSTCSNGLASCPTGAVSVTNNGSPLAGGSLPLNAAGYAEDQSLAAGSYAVSANFPGDASYGPSSAAANFTINKAPTTASAAVAGLPVQYGNYEQISAGISTTSNGIAPTGTVTFLVDGAQINAGPITYEGFSYDPNSSPPSYAWLGASGSTYFLSVGSHTLSAQYTGDANYAAATSPATTVNVTQAQPFFQTWGANPNPASWQQQVTLNASMYGSSFGVAPTGTMTFYDNGNPIAGTVTYTSGNGGSSSFANLNASMNYTPTTPGNHSITASYSGDTNYLSATTPVPNVMTVSGPFSVTPAGGITVASPGNSGTTTVTVAPNGSFTGTVTLTCSPDPLAKEVTCNFVNGSSTVTSIPVNVNGSSVSVTVSVATTAPHALTSRKHLIFESSIGMVFAGFFVLPLLSRRHRGLSAAGALLLLICVLFSCGGGSSGAGSAVEVAAEIQILELALEPTLLLFPAQPEAGLVPLPSLRPCL